MKRPLVYYGNPLLRKKSDPIESITPEIEQLAADMIEIMDASNGIGLAAVQVGVLLRMFVLRRYIHKVDQQWEVSDPYVYINPMILEHSSDTIEEEEGCLSIPKIDLPVQRPIKIKVSATRLDGSQVIEELEGINARVVLHENDHLNGVLYIDRTEEKYLTPLIKEKLQEIKIDSKQHLLTKNERSKA